MTCSVYRIDPTELGFQFKDQAQIFGQDGQKARLQHSREKGLKPILIFLENVITKYIVSELDEDFEFSFTGIEVEDEEAQVKLDAEKLEKGMVAMQDIFQKYSGRPLDPENEEQRHNIQYFGARVNVLKALLTGLNGGYDDVHKDYKVFDIDPVRDEVLDFDTVKANFEKSLDWLTDTYVDALNIIHYMTDKYNYEAVQMAFLPTKQRANMGFGICGFANTVDTLSAIKYATVKPIRDEDGYIYDYETIGEYPRWGEDDPRSNELAEWLIEAYTTRLRSHKLYKDAEATVSLLTITSNVAYSKQTGNSPVHKGVYLNEDGSVNLSKLEFFSPGANPSNKAKGGWLQNLNSLASLDFGYAADGISLTTQVSPRALGQTHDEQVDNLVTILDGYFENGGQHVNLNVMDLSDVYEKIMSGEDVIVRISGYCVNTKYLTPEQKTELTQRVFHEVLSMDDALG